VRTDNNQQLRMYWQQHGLRVWRCSYASRVVGPKDSQRQLRSNLGGVLCFDKQHPKVLNELRSVWLLYTSSMLPRTANGLGLAFIAVDAE
jgi:hypothetical protein